MATYGLHTLAIVALAEIERCVAGGDINHLCKSEIIGSTLHNVEIELAVTSIST